MEVWIEIGNISAAGSVDLQKMEIRKGDILTRAGTGERVIFRTKDRDKDRDKDRRLG
jgi:hypothetical protein